MRRLWSVLAAAGCLTSSAADKSLLQRRPGEMDRPVLKERCLERRLTDLGGLPCIDSEGARKVEVAVVDFLRPLQLCMWRCEAAVLAAAVRALTTFGAMGVPLACVETVATEVMSRPS